MSTVITNQDKNKLPSCHYLLHKLKYSMREGVPINEHCRINDYKYYWSDCPEFKAYVNELNTSKNVTINVKGNNIYKISTTINDQNMLVTYDLHGHNYDSYPNDEYVPNPGYKQECFKLF